jgi:hypothetical protein
MIYENPVGHPTFCMEPVEWVGRWKFLKGWRKVCGRVSGTPTNTWVLGGSSS